MPGLNYRLMTRAATAAVMQDEAAFYDQILESDGSPAQFDVMVTDINGDPALLTAQITRQKPRPYALTKGDGTPGLSEPARTTDVFGGPRSLVGFIEAMGGRTMKFEGLTYTIAYVKPHEVAGVIYFVEIHADLNDGIFQPNALNGLL